MRTLLFLTSVACFLILFIFLATKSPNLFRKTDKRAAEYCLNSGGERIAKKDQAGNFFTFCRFPDGFICEEGAFYRNECRQIEE